MTTPQASPFGTLISLASWCLHASSGSPRFIQAVACVVALTGAPLFAGDLAVSSVELQQGYQSSGGTTTLVAGRPTAVRVKIAVTGQTTSQANVDAVLRVKVNGTPMVGSPFFSRNGPITAPISPNSANLNDTLNFTIVAPVSTDVDFEVLVDPRNLVAESNESNNLYSLSNKTFACRKTLDIAYVSVNYTPGGGQPAAATIEPGIGDGFYRGIYPHAELNYHRTPTGPLTWSQDINSSNNALLSALQTLRLTTIPAAGYARPEFVYGWLPGNPFSGNGQAIGIPGDAAFGNSESSRFQRTCAHEIGHCWGLSHTNSTLGTVGFDVEHHLATPLNLAQTHASSQSDVMVAGLLTNQAWVNTTTYADCLTDTRNACGAFDAPGGGETPSQDWVRAIHLTGSFEHSSGLIRLDVPSTLDAVTITPDDPRGDVLIQSIADDGTLLHSIRWRSATTRESCAGCTKGAGCMHATSPVSILVPADRRGRAPARVELRDIRSGRVLAEQVRSSHVPEIVTVGSIPRMDGRDGSGEGAPSLCGHGPYVELRWSATDADGDSLRANILYSRDGGESWTPLAVHQTAESFTFSLADIPAPDVGVGRGLVHVRVNDGLNFADTLIPAAFGFFDPSGSPEGGLAGADWSGSWLVNPPDIHLLTPNSGNSFPQGAAILLHASGWDLENQFLSDSAFTWRSSIAGPIGTGRQILVASLAPGAHTITLRGTDSSGLFTERTVNITVTARTLYSIDIDSSGAVDGSDLAALLSNWLGTGVGDINFDGVVDGSDLTLLLSAWTN
ncbi:MAG: hypothetical protein FJ256_05135 [Phycisphaerae bacterium]|nr:hypothetical protein [Phycisphaerae bacterium]